MYLRTKLQPRAHHNLKLLASKMYPDMRVSKGYVISGLLMRYPELIQNSDKLKKSILESDLKQGEGIAINLNITSDANKKLAEVKKILDHDTGRSLFPAQILDILLQLSLSCEEEENDEISSNQTDDITLARALIEIAFQLVTEEIHSASVREARKAFISILKQHHLLT